MQFIESGQKIWQGTAVLYICLYVRAQFYHVPLHLCMEKGQEIYLVSR
jgi:hypothetical protein